jgi:hypothetical protein
MSQQSKQETDCLDRTLAALDPAREAWLTTSGVDGALEAIGAAIVTRRQDASRRRWSWRLTGARRLIAVAAALALLAGVATARDDAVYPNSDSHLSASVGDHRDRPGRASQRERDGLSSDRAGALGRHSLPGRICVLARLRDQGRAPAVRVGAQQPGSRSVRDERDLRSGTGLLG